MWLLILIPLALLALIIGAIAARAWNQSTDAPNPAFETTVVLPSSTLVSPAVTPGGSGGSGVLTTPGALAAVAVRGRLTVPPPLPGVTMMALREQNPLGGEASRSRQPLTVQSGQAQPPSSRNMELSRG